MDGTASNQAIIAALENWGCDIKGALPRFLNDEAFYVKLLKGVPNDEAFVKLGDHLKINDAKGAFEAAHELKGMLGNMGLTPMYNTVCRLVEPLRAGKIMGIGEDYDALMVDLAKLKTIIK